MPDIDSRLTRLIALRAEGRHAQALPLLQQLFADGGRVVNPARSSYFIPMLEWKFLAEAYAPAYTALQVERDAQIRLLLSGEHVFGRHDSSVPPASNAFGRASRFSLIVEMNETLGDVRSTADLFARLDVSAPELARRYAWQALPAVVEVGNFALAERYRCPAPLAHLETVNTLAASQPLLPAPGTAPRLAAELMNLVKDVRIAAAVLRGQGQAAEADALCAALLAGLANDAMRTLAQRELDAPGSITAAIVKRQMDEEQQA
ncbi:hypothetical protein JAB5_52710 [Janthinobacterium sp. HH103]|uniref:hypothetical protein n=1 Tax=unclassified Janthinobacterium TaxID=2610881 RepID=UPI000874B5D1|nr:MULTISPECIES: hypothetical protein [unclassified Janthinobacterium]OEZ67924.1 hypothetical protein JAB5_52710 [Janthinobacterium sp. HH103]OEZ70074.1 hypothetical protein JAB2_10050 [Janthinobacterium sp. HH100]QOU75225.1 hypothetical protein JAB4_047070 [Janthinobacterium sp. HH102]